jgi:hypothetical protein
MPKSLCGTTRAFYIPQTELELMAREGHIPFSPYLSGQPKEVFDAIYCR